MKSYLISLAAVAVIAALTGLLTTSDGKDSGLRLLTGFCVLAVVSAPFVSGLRAISSPDFSFLSVDGDGEIAAEYETLFRDSIKVYGGAYIADRLTEQLAARYARDASCFSVRLTLSEDGTHITAATVLLGGSAVFLDTYDLENYVTDILGCPCTTAIG